IDSEEPVRSRRRGGRPSRERQRRPITVQDADFRAIGRNQKDSAFLHERNRYDSACGRGTLNVFDRERESLVWRGGSRSGIRQTEKPFDRFTDDADRKLHLGETRSKDRL